MANDPKKLILVLGMGLIALWIAGIVLANVFNVDPDQLCGQLMAKGPALLTVSNRTILSSLYIYFLKLNNVPPNFILF